MMNTAISTIQLSGTDILPSWANGGEFKTIIANGIILRYLEIGQGEPLVLSHTIRSQLDYFQKVIPELAKHYRVYAIDLPAHGHSEITDRSLSKPMLVNTVTDFISALNLGEVTLMGESIGASISLGVTTKRNVKVKQVLALNPADYENSNGLDRSSLLGKILFTGIRLPLLGLIISNAEQPMVLKKVFEGGFKDNSQLPTAFLEEVSRQGNRKGFPKAFRSIFLNWNSWAEGAKKYADIKVPVTLIYSENDWSLPAERTKVHKLIAHSKLITVADCGHFSALEKPTDILNIVLANK